MIPGKATVFTLAAMLDDMGLLLRALMNDGYLVKDREQYRFRSPLLRDYWKETYC